MIDQAGFLTPLQCSPPPNKKPLLPQSVYLTTLLYCSFPRAELNCAVFPTPFCSAYSKTLPVFPSLTKSPTVVISDHPLMFLSLSSICAPEVGEHI